MRNFYAWIYLVFTQSLNITTKFPQVDLLWQQLTQWHLTFKSLDHHIKPLVENLPFHDLIGGGPRHHICHFDVESLHTNIQHWRSTSSTTLPLTERPYLCFIQWMYPATHWTGIIQQLLNFWVRLFSRFRVWPWRSIAPNYVNLYVGQFEKELIYKTETHPLLSKILLKIHRWRLLSSGEEVSRS